MALYFIIFIIISIVLISVCYLYADSVADFLINIIKFLGGKEDE